MGDGQEQDHYEERLKEVFDSFDASGCGSLTPEELADLCRSLQLEDATPALLHALLQNQDRLSARVDFQQFKTALIQVLYSTFPGAQEEQEAPPPTASPEIQPKFVKGSKRYGRRSTPEFLETTSGVPDVNPADGSLEDNDDSAVPRKRERWNSQESSSDEFEAEGQMHLWNPDGPSTPRGSVAPLSVRLEAELRRACEELEMAWDGHAARSELLVLCESLGLEPGADALLDPDEQMDVQEFVSRLMTQPKPPTPSASTPYRQLKRHHSTQSFDEVGRRIPAFSSTTATPLFSWLDDGAGHAAAERVLDVWMDEGVENGVEILQSLSVEPDGRLNLCDLAAALESELLVTKNGVLRAALASFKAEIRHLLENVEQEIREKEKIRSDLEKAEKQKSQLASEVDERHAAIERANSLNLRRLEQEHKERLGAVRSELMKEVEQIQQQAGLQREKAEAEIAKIKEEESLLRDHLSISLKENRRLETELLDGAEELEEAQGQILKLQRSLESLMKEKFGDVDPSSADLLLQEERIKQLRSSYEAQCRELQDRIDELQAELQDLHPLSKGHAPTHKALSEELESQSPGMESDPGIGSEEVQPFSLSLEAEMMLERLKEQHLQQMEELQEQLEIKVNEFNRRLEKQQEIHEEQKASLSLRHQEELGALREEMLSVRSHAQELQNQLEGAELKPAAGGEELQSRGAEVGPFRQQLQEALRVSADLEEQLKALEVQQTEEKEQLLRKMEELKEQHAVEISKLKEEQEELLEARKEEKSELERRLSAEWEQEKDALEVSHENQLRVRLEEVKVKFEEEKGELVRRLTEQWEEEKAQLDLQRNETLQVLLEEEMLRLVVDQEEKENSLREQWERERAKLEEHHEEVLHGRILEERLQLQEQSEQRERRLKEEWEKEKLQLEEDYEGMIQERLGKEKEKLEEKEKMEREAAEERELLEERHREAMKELSSKHGEERSALRGELQKLRDDVALERKEVESSFTQRISDVETRLSCDQETVAERFRADVLKLEHNYQNELQVLSEDLLHQKLLWEAETQRALEEQRAAMEEAVEQERGRKQELENVHREEMEAVRTENLHLQEELDEAVSKEIELSMQLNGLHSRLQEQHQLLAQTDGKALQAQLLLHQTVESFQQEREQLLRSISELEAQVQDERRSSERHAAELLTERDLWKVKEEELQEDLSGLQKRGQDVAAERDELRVKVQELEAECRRVLDSAEEEGTQEEILHSTSAGVGLEHLDRDAFPRKTKCDEDQDGAVLKASPLEESRVSGEEVVPDPSLKLHDLHQEAWERRSCDRRSGSPDAYFYSESPIHKAVFDAASTEDGRSPLGGEEHHETVVEASTPEETRDLQEDSAEEAEVDENHLECSHDAVEDRENQEEALLTLQALCRISREENLLLHQKVSLLRQKTGILENLLDHHSANVHTSHHALEENYSLKVQMLLLLEHVRDLEMKALNTAELQIRYEDCRCENAKLKEQSAQQEQQLWSLEGKLKLFQDFQYRGFVLMDDIGGMKEENSGLLLLLAEPERQEEPPADPGEAFSLEDSCRAFERQNMRLRRSIAQLQGHAHTLNQKTRAQRSEAGRLAQENLALRKKISALEEGDLNQEELLETLERLKKEKSAAQKAAETFKRQSRRLEDQNGVLAERNAQSAAHLERLQLKEREGPPAEGHARVAACVSALEAELTNALEDTAQLENRNSQLSQQLCELREKAARSQLSQILAERQNADREVGVLQTQLAKAQEKTEEENLQAAARQNARLKADLKAAQQEKDSLKREVAVLHKKLLHTQEKNRTLEAELHSSGKKMFREEAKEQHLLRLENERLQADARGLRNDLVQAREKVHQLDATILSLSKHKQAGQASALKALEQENAALKRELQAQREQGCEAARSGAEWENLQLENEALKAQMSRLSSQLLESFQAQLVGLLPPSPHRVQRGHRAEEPENLQDERKMRAMEERMKEIELSLHNVKLLLKEKVAQLKDQLHKNGKADVLIQDLYVENAQLMKALEITEQRHKIAEKKNYLLEEKISSLNKIVRDLNPAPAYSYK
ncbi:ninein isoform X2 [Oryzias latipes]|uniref:ninein isoform X2 n=1 Tax=Oryzias latipes TaxID=8090 RepID=UPI000CE2680B|nr:ninein isoform X2 [Oryzias latipes]